MFPLTSTEIATNEQVSPELYNHQKDSPASMPDKDLYYQLHAQELKNDLARRKKMASFEEFYKMGALKALEDAGLLKSSGDMISVVNEPPKPGKFQRTVAKAVNAVNTPKPLPKNPAVFA